jgi:penicillin-binding protein 1C
MKLKVTKQELIRFFKWLGVGVLAAIVIFFILSWIFPLPDKIEYSTIITDSKGEVINAYLTKDQKWRMKTELNEISPLLRKTIIAKEDKYFYSHPGINPVAMVKAFLQKCVQNEDCFGRQHHYDAGGKSIGTQKKEYW